VDSQGRVAPLDRQAMKAVLLPGLDGTGQLFKWFKDSAPPGLTCIAAHYPPSQVLDYDGCASLVLRDFVPRGRFILVAESFSGPVAILAGSQRPPGLVAVILCNTFAMSPAWHGFAHLPWTAMLSLGVPSFTIGLHLTGFRHARKFAGPIRDANRRVEPSVRAARMRSAFSVEVRPQLAALPYPVQYLRGSRDHLVLSSSVRHVVAARPGTRVVTIDGPHLLLQVKPALCWEAIVSFLREADVLD